MGSFQENISEYRKQLAKGAIKEAYRGLMAYFEKLRLHLANKHPDYFVSGSIHPGNMDYTYFYFLPKSLKNQKLKVVLLFIHDSFTFEVWLAGYNKSVQAKYLELFKDSNLQKYSLASTTKGVDFILRNVLTDSPDFSNLQTLTNQLEKGMLQFIGDIERFILGTNEPQP